MHMTLEADYAVSKWDAEASLFKWNVIHVKRLKNGRNMENLHVYGENGAYISRFFCKKHFFPCVSTA